MPSSSASSPISSSSSPDLDFCISNFARKVDEDYKRMVILTAFLQVYISSGLSFSYLSNDFVFIIV
ncbi:unnamed protein product [Camellia sinensis]